MADHQPVEHLAALRAIPGLCLLPGRPDRDRRMLAARLRRRDAPEPLASTRQSLPLLRHESARDSRSAHGAYAGRGRGRTAGDLLATGSEVSIETAVPNPSTGIASERAMSCERWATSSDCVVASGSLQ